MQSNFYFYNISMQTLKFRFISHAA